MNELNVNDISAFQDDSTMGMEDREPLSAFRTGDKGGLNYGNNAEYFEVPDNVGANEQKGARFKDDEEHLDFLKDLRKKQVTNNAKKKKKDGDSKDGDAPEGTAEGTGEKTDDTAGEGIDLTAEEEKFMEEDTGSVASSTKSLMKHLRMLRNALYENYSPPSIRNLKMYAKIVFLVLLVITIAWYVYSKSIYNKLQENI